MSLFAEIQNDILGDKPISSILRKARVLAHHLKNQEFNSWVESELNGYTDKAALLDYRKIISPIFGDFIGGTKRITNVSIPLDPEKWGEIGEMLKSPISIGDGVKKIEADIDAADNANKNELRVQLPSNLYKYFSNSVYPNMNCLDAWKVISRQQLVQILETVRDRLQKFTLELSDIYPDYAKTDFDNNPSISNDKIFQAFQQFIILGNPIFVGKDGNMSIFDQKNQTVGYQYNAAGNINFNNVESPTELIAELEKLKLELKQAIQAKIVDDEIGTDVEYKLTKAIQLSRKPKPDKKTILENINEAKALLSGFSSAVGLVTALIKAAELASKFF